MLNSRRALASTNDAVFAYVGNLRPFTRIYSHAHTRRAERPKRRVPIGALTLPALRRYAIARTLFAPTTLPDAIDALGFVQADPIRAPARAQDLTLRHRVRDYRVGDLERIYPQLGIEEDFFINYGFVPRATQNMMHPRAPRRVWTRRQHAQARDVLAFVRDLGVAHPRDVHAALQHGKVTNWFGGSSNTTTQLLDGLHYRGLLRVARRESGVRLYSPRDYSPPTATPAATMDTLVDIVVAKYAPLPERSLGELVGMLRGGVPQWAHLCRDALQRAKERLASATVEGVRWFWPAGETPIAHVVDAKLRFLAPFDPLVWDRRRFSLLWDWDYRFEAYTPATKRVRGYYAHPVLWRDKIVGWANVLAKNGNPQAELGFVSRKPTSKAFHLALDEELERLRTFLTADT